MREALVRDTLRVSVLTVLSKIAGALKTVVIARYFGAAATLDTYLLAFLPVSFIIDVISGSMMNALLPAFIALRESRQRPGALELYGSVQLRLAGILIFIGVVLAAAAGPILHILATGFDEEKIRLTRELMFIMLPILPLSALNVSWRVLLNAEGRFSIAAISPALVPVATVIALISLTQRYGIFSLAIGTVVGAVAESILLAHSVWKSGAAMFAGFRTRSTDTPRVFAQYLPTATANLVMASSAVVDQSMAAMLGSGSVAILNYGTRLVTVVLAIGPAALGTVILPWLSRLHARGDGAQIRKTLIRYILISLAVTIPLTAILMVWSKGLIEILFQRGAFTISDTGSVARVQEFALLRVPLSVLLALLLPTVASLQRNSLLLVVAVFSVIANVLLNLAFMQTLGVAGVALSTAIVHLLAVLFLVDRLLRSGGKLRAGEPRHQESA